MNDIDTARIKEKFYHKLEGEKILRGKKKKISAIILAAAVAASTSVSVLAANLGAFNTFFSNFGDVAKYVQTSSVKARSNGITMELSSYLADDKGIVPELIFTRDDGSAFAGGTRAVGSRDALGVSINNAARTVTQIDKVSDDGKMYYCLPIVHYDIENAGNVSLEISAGKLIYNVSERHETAGYDFNGAYKNSDIKTYDGIGLEDLPKLFDNVPDNPVQTEIGTTIYSVVFAKVKAAPAKLSPDMPPADGVDLGALSSRDYDNIVGIKFAGNVARDGMERDFQPTGLPGADDPFGFGAAADDGAYYHFFRVDDFDDLINIKGIDFLVASDNFINGDWHIKTTFAANKDPSAAAINEEIAAENPDTSLTLIRADISLLSTKLTYEVRDKNGNILTDISGNEMNNYFRAIANNEVRLRYSDGNEIGLMNPSYSAPGDAAGIITLSYEEEMNPGNYALMNTAKLTAVVVGGKAYNIARGES